MQSKFKVSQLVKVSGEATGYGDLIGVIDEICFDRMYIEYYGEPFYQVRVINEFTNGFFVAEKFLSPVEEGFVE